MIPNYITFLRICLATPIIVLLVRGNHYAFPIAGFLILIATLTDGLDGYVARRYNMTSLFGAMFDLTADRIIMTPSIVLLALNGRFQAASHLMPLCPWLFVVPVVLGDITTLAGIVAFNLQRRKNPDLEFPSPPRIVKITYPLQMFPVLLAAFFAGPPILLTLAMYIGLLFTLISAVVYLKKGGFVFTGK